MSKEASRLVTHIEIKIFNNDHCQEQGQLGHWKFLVGYWILK